MVPSTRRTRSLWHRAHLLRNRRVTPSDKPVSLSLSKAAQLTRAALNAVGLDAMLMLDGTGGIALLVPFDDHPNYNDVRIWLHGLANALATVHGGLFTTEPNTHGGSLVHIHVSHNAPGMFSALPYSARGLENLPIALPIPWELLDTISTASITVADSPHTLHNMATH